MSQPNAPFISVIIPFFNLQGFIERALQCLVEQKFQDFEIICINDGSTDESAQKVRDFREKHSLQIQLIEQENKGAPAARNAGLRLAQGEYIQFLDGDDYLKPSKLATQVDLLKKCPERVDLVVGNFLEVLEGKIWEVTTDVQDPWVSLFSNKMGITSANLWRRESVVKVGGWDENRAANQEYYLMFELLKEGAKVIADPYFNTYKLLCRPGAIWETILKDPEKFYEAMKFRGKVFDYLREQGRVNELYQQAYKKKIYSQFERLYRFNIYDKEKLATVLGESHAAQLEQEIHNAIHELWNSFVYQKSGERKKIRAQLLEYGSLSLAYGVELLARKSEPFDEIAQIIQTIGITNPDLANKVYQLYQQETKLSRQDELAAILANSFSYEFTSWCPSAPADPCAKTMIIKRFFPEDMLEVEEVLSSEQIPYQPIKWVRSFPEFPKYQESYDIHLLREDFPKAIRLLKEAFFSEESIDHCPACGSELPQEQEITVCPECELNLGFSEEESLTGHPFYQFVQNYRL